MSRESSTLGLAFEITADPTKALLATNSFRSQASAALAEFEAQLASTVTAALGITKEFAIGMGVATGAVIGLGLATYELAAKAAEVGSKMYEAHERTGLAVENLSALNAITTITGGSFDSLSMSLSRIGVKLQAAIDNPAARSSALLKEVMGGAQQLHDLGLKPLDDRVQIMLHHIFEINDVAEQHRALQALMGRGWMANVEALKMLAEEGYGPAIERAKELGLYFDASSATKAKEFETQVNLLKASMNSLAMTIGQYLIPYVSDAIVNWNVWLEVLKQEGPWNTAKILMQGFHADLLRITSGIIGMHAGFKDTAKMFDEAAVGIDKLINSDKTLSKIWEEQDKLLKLLQEKYKEHGKDVGDMTKHTTIMTEEFKKWAESIPNVTNAIHKLQEVNFEKMMKDNAVALEVMVSGLKNLDDILKTDDVEFNKLLQTGQKAPFIISAVGPVADGATVALWKFNEEMKKQQEIKFPDTSQLITNELIHQAMVLRGLPELWEHVDVAIRKADGGLKGAITTFSKYGDNIMQVLDMAGGALRRHHALEIGLILARAAIRGMEELAEAFAAAGMHDYHAAAMHKLAAAEFFAMGALNAAATATSGGGGGGGGGYGSGSSSGEAPNPFAPPPVMAPGVSGGAPAGRLHVIISSDRADLAQYIGGILNDSVRYNGMQLIATQQQT